jgi:hypothetical protein
MKALYPFIFGYALCLVVAIPVALRAAWRFSRPMTGEEINSARQKTENDICYDCGGPINRNRSHKRLFDRCDMCDSSA